MPSTTNCPSCARALTVPDELIGQQVQCPTCGATFTAQVGRGSPPPSGQQPQPPQAPPSAPPPYQQPAYQQPPARRDDDDDYERRRRPRQGDKPGNVQAVNVLTLIGGIVALVGALIYVVGIGLPTVGFGCIWPGWIYAIVAGILATIKGSKLMGENAQMEEPPTTAGILLIINIVNCDVISCVLGILILVFLNDPVTKNWYQGGRDR
jgi:hypothetical protein